ncbi:MAG TPA: radical SAM protein [Thermoplasmatales archaeon]|nr:radical SAM protein [Thermoplasmatales archaeon]
MVSDKTSLQTGLPKTTMSICPECGKVIPARVYEEDGRVMMEKTCPEHGTFKDVYWSDVEMYLMAEEWAKDGKGVSNPQITGVKPEQCPFVCGLCNVHLSHTCLANLDLTNRCNLQCPICFANANAVGYVYEPSYEEVVRMMETLRNEKPVPTTAIQFAGGEPTIYPRFFDVIRKAKELGFSQIQVATNGLKLVDPDFCQKMRDAGMNTVYLQFDGLKEEDYIATRGRKLLDVKMKAIENCRKVKPKPLSTVLVPTILKTVNDDQVGEIVNFAVKNADVIRAVNYQPVAFTGRIEKEERERQRYTLTDLVHDLEEQTDFLRKEDFYPVPVVVPVSELISLFTGKEELSFTAHPHCGLATFVVIDKAGNPTPVTQFVDVKGMFKRMDELYQKFKRFAFLAKTLSKLKGKTDLSKTFDKYFGEFIDKSRIPDGLNLIDMLSELSLTHDKRALGKFTWRAMMIGGMHFQDSYNYDIERVKRCVIHYVVPDGRIIPFCAYNGGPTYRNEVEQKYSVPLEEWKRRHASV